MEHVLTAVGWQAMSASIISICALMAAIGTKNEKEDDELAKTPGGSKEYVFLTQHLKRYRFPTHINDIIIDRAQSTQSEVFMVVVEPEKAPPFHKHDDTEQVFYVIEGTGVLTIGEKKEQHTVKPGDVVRIPGMIT